MRQQHGELKAKLDEAAERIRACSKGRQRFSWPPSVERREGQKRIYRAKESGASEPAALPLCPKRARPWESNSTPKVASR